MISVSFTEDASRVGLALVFFWSMIEAAIWAWRMHSVFLPHLLFVVFWSPIAAWGMLALSTVPVPMWETVAIELLNFSVACVVAGWFTLFRRRLAVVS